MSTTEQLQLFPVRFLRAEPVAEPTDGDRFFDQFGDMLSINELRGLDLALPGNCSLRDKYLAEYTAAGLDPDQDPGEFTLEVPRLPGETPDEMVARVVDIAGAAFRLRLASPDDLTKRA